MITIPYMMLVGAHFKSAVGGVRESTRNNFPAAVRASRGLFFGKFQENSTIQIWDIARQIGSLYHI